MPDNNKITNYYNFSNNMLATQSILDVFVLQDLIDQSDADRLQARFKTNREIEEFLVKNRIVTKDTVNKAYSIILKLPYVELKSVEIPESLKNLIPEKFARKLGIIPFGIDESVVRIALSRPADLLVGFRESIEKLFLEKKLEIELFITGESDFKQTIKQYSKNYKSDLLVKKGSLPVVFLRNQVIPKKYLDKIPHDFIAKYRLVVFGQNQKGLFQVACEQPDSPITLKILDFIKRENGVKFEVFATSKEDIDYVLDSNGLNLSESNLPENKETPEKVEKPSKTEDENQATSKSTLKSLLDSFLQDRGPDFTVDTIIGDEERKQNIDLNEKPVQENSAENAIKTESIIPSQQQSVDIAPKPESQAEGNMGTDLDSKNLGSLLSVDVKDEKTLEEISKEGSVPKIVAAILNYALNKRSSDIHVEPESKFLRIRCRVDGILKDILKLPLSMHAPFISRVKIMSKLKIDEARIPQDGRFETVFNSREVDVRVSILPTVHGEKVVMRILDKSQGILSLEDLGMQGSAFDKTSEAISKPYGIILATGPTGSGKSTTLYAILNRISVPGVNIVTLEDPVEYEIPGINQCQIKPEIGFTFAAGLRSILRQDPNIIMVGEIRDAETAGMTTHAALTGHLVLSTLHTNDTAGALPRLINMGVEPFLITSSINLVIAQRLVRRICPKCKEEIKPPAKLIEQIKRELDQIPISNTRDRERIPQNIKLYHGKGCSECNQGFKGRVGIFEVMTITPEIEDLAVAKQPANEIKTAALKSGMITMKQDGILKAVEGLTTIDEVFQAVITS